MAVITYKETIDRVISKYEGGYGWNKKDPGGPTKYGVTCWDLAEHMGQKMDSMSRWAPIVQAMTLATAEEIYVTKYAAALHYNDLPAGTDAVMLDYGINSGNSRPIRVARAILKVPGAAVMDGALLGALQKANPSTFIDAMCAERLSFMHAIRGGSAWAEFGGGWGARVADLKAYSHHLASASGSVAPTAPDLTKVSLPKAKHGDPSIVTKTVTGTVGTATSTGAASHMSGLPIELTAVLAGFCIVGGIAFIMYEKQKADQANAKVVLPIPIAGAPPVVAAA